MSLASLAERIERKYANLDGARLVTLLGESLSDELQNNSPEDTGTIAEAVSEVGQPRQAGSAWEIGVGNLERLGTPSTATRGTIAAFLEKYPKYRRNNAWKQSVGFRKNLAWWYLPETAKEILQWERAAGNFGGAAYYPGAPARYYYVQSGEGSWAGSSLKSGNSPTLFTTRSLAVWRLRIGSIVKSWLNYGG